MDSMETERMENTVSGEEAVKKEHLKKADKTYNMTIDDDIKNARWRMAENNDTQMLFLLNELAVNRLLGGTKLSNKAVQKTMSYFLGKITTGNEKIRATAIYDKTVCSQDEVEDIFDQPDALSSDKAIIIPRERAEKFF